MLFRSVDTRTLVIEPRDATRLQIGSLLGQCVLWHHEVTDLAAATEELRRAALTAQPYDLVLVSSELPPDKLLRFACKLPVESEQPGIRLVWMHPMTLPVESSLLGVYKERLAKPVRRDPLMSLLRMLDTSTGTTTTRPPHPVKIDRYDAFRVLLVEDNAVNQKVARAIDRKGVV